MNGKPGDHPITDVLKYDLIFINEEITALIKAIESRRGRQFIDTLPFNWFQPPPPSETAAYFRGVLDEIDGQSERD